MASAVAATDLDEMECSVCHELFTDPKLLPCGHCLCRHCLLSWLQSEHQALCPLCRSPIVEADQGEDKSLEDIADGFPTDLSMASLVEAQRLLSRDHQCRVCDDVAATSLCLECGDMLCGQCRQAHKKLSMSKDHVVEALSSLTAEKVAANRPGYCTTHAKRVTELWCPTHAESICQLCAMSRHRGCPELADLDEKMTEARAILAQLAARLTAGERRLDGSIRQLDEHLKATERQTKAALAEIEAECTRLENAVKACRLRLTKLVRSAEADVKKAVFEAKSCLSGRRGKLTAHKQVVERVQDAKNRDTVTNMTPTLRNRVDNLDFSATLPAEAKVVSKVTLVIDPESVASIQKGLLQLGQMDAFPFIFLGDSQEDVFRFHDNHGSNVVLSNDKTAARRATTATENGIVLSRDPMMPNMVYEVKIYEMDDNSRTDFTMLGVLMTSPSVVTLPASSRIIKPALVVCSNAIFDDANMTETKRFWKLNDLKVGSILGVILDSRNYLHVLMDGKVLGAVKLPFGALRCYALFDIGYTTTVVTAMPVRRINE